MKQKMKKIYIGCTLLVLVLLLGLATWLITRNKSTEGEQVAKNVLGIEWYDENGSEFTISTAEELYELAELSLYYDFAGQTIKLGADIVVNDGNAADWAEKKPEKDWESIYGFAGTFDGQGHTISGLYCFGFLYMNQRYRVEDRTEYVTAGLFRSTQEECVIKNFKLVNSYFVSDLNAGVGGISSNGAGTFDSIYTDVIIVSEKNYVGGIIGMIEGTTKVTNCNFAGSLEVVGGYGRYVGGIVGGASKDTATASELTIEHCLVDGVVISDLYNRGVNMGGILGNTSNMIATISDCLMSGMVHNDWKVVGSVVGNVVTETEATISNVFTTKESFSVSIGNVGGALEGMPVSYEKDTLIGYGGYQWTTLDFNNYWAVVDGGTPVLKTFAENVPSLDGVSKMVNVSWYNEEQDTFILNDLTELFGFAILSNSTDFEGKTVKLGADITVNTGKASKWAKEVPQYKWLVIGSKNLPFAGTFDGQMHTISGVYLKTEDSYSGLFARTARNAVVKRFKLVNSYFESSAASFGSIAGRATGTYDTIYSNAIVVSSKGNVGGLIGQVTSSSTEESLKMTNCWFDGTVTNTGNDTGSKRTGGLIGFAVVNTKLSNCLNTGTIDMSAYNCKNSATSETIQPLVAGLVANSGANAKLDISHCLSVGEVKYNKAATSGYGSIIGISSGQTEITDTYATKECCKKTASGNVNGQVITYAREKLLGYGGYQWTSLDFQKYWAVVEGGTSILRSFASKVPSLNGVARMLDFSWYDAKKDSYTLYDKEDLYGFAVLASRTNFKDKTIKLGADIVVNEGNAGDWATESPLYDWVCIGSSSLPFAGTFDGQMHSVSGVYLKADQSYQGFFGRTTDTATIKNFKLLNSYFESSAASFGSIAGRGTGTYDTVYSNAIVVSSSGNVGGLIGQVTGSIEESLTMNNCWFDGSVTNTGNTTACKRTGGLLGFVVVDAKVTNCLNTATVDMSAYDSKNSATSETIQPMVGGLIGNSAATSNLIVSCCMNVGQVKYNKACTSGYGSIMGISSGKTKLSDVYTTTESCKKTIAGSYEGDVISYNLTKLMGYGGYQWTTLDYQTYWAVVEGGTSVLKSFAKTIPSLNGIANMMDMSWYDAAKDTYVLYDAADLFGFALLTSNTDFANKTIYLGADITINEGTPYGADGQPNTEDDWSKVAPSYEWASIGSNSLPFAGTFDGKDPVTGQIHKISGVYLKTDQSYKGFFGRTGNTSVLKNFRLEDSYFESSAASFGSIAGRGTGTYDTVYSNAIVVSSSGNVAGLIGQVTGSVGDSLNMTNCWFDGSVTNTGNTTASKRTGGLLGFVVVDAEVTNCLNTAIVDASAYSCKNSATSTTVQPMVGGLIGNSGENSNLTISSSMNVGEVKYNAACTSGYGSIMGISSGQTKLSDTYTTTESCKNTLAGNYEGDVITYKETKLLGYGGYQWTSLDFQTYWAVAEGDTPVLQSFAQTIPSLDGVARMLDTSWYDADKDTYVLYDAADLYGFALLASKTDFANKTIKLGANITINEGTPFGADGKQGTNDDWSKVAPSYEWASVGSSSLPFAGTFDGADPVTGEIHTISGIYMSATSAEQGLFKDTANSCVVQNLKLTNSYFYSTARRLGSIAGRFRGSMNNVYSNAIVVSNVSGTSADVGGLIGVVGNSTSSNVSMDSCWFDGTVTNMSTTAVRTGGLVGTASMKTFNMTNCLNTGVVDVSKCTQTLTCAAGLVGVNLQGTLSMKCCIHNAQVLEGSKKAYAILGDSGSSTTKGTLKLEAVYYGGHTRTYNKSGATNGNFDGAGTGTFIQIKSNTDFSTLLNTSKWVDVSYKNPIPKALESVIIDVDTSWYDANKDTYVLYDRADLFGFAKLSQEITFEGKTVKLGADIVVNTGTAADWANTAPMYKWTPIGKAESGAFAGTFDGADPETGKIHTISGIYLSATTEQAGLFKDTASSSVVRNLKLTNSYFYSTERRLGSIAGRFRGSMNNVYSDAVIVSNVTRAGRAADVGGLIGVVGNSTSANVKMDNCWFAGTVTNMSETAVRTGGLVGTASMKTLDITNCLNTGVIDVSKCTQTLTCAAGLVGVNLQGTLSMKNCMHNAQVIEGSNKAYAILGDSGSSTTKGTLKLEAVYYGGHTRTYNKSGATNGNFDGAGSGTFIQMKSSTDYSPLLNTEHWINTNSDLPYLGFLGSK